MPGARNTLKVSAGQGQLEVPLLCVVLRRKEMDLPCLRGKLGSESQL